MISVLMTSYNRPQFLTQCVEALRSALDQTQYELIISDDCSEPQHLKLIEAVKPDVLLTNTQRRGMGANLNRAIQAARGDYHLILQDDFRARCALNLRVAEAVMLLDVEPDTDTVRLGSPMDSRRFYPEHHGVDTRAFIMVNFVEERRGQIVRVTAKQGAEDHSFVYSDNPHIRRATFLDKFGWYPEGLSMSDTEIAYMRRCNKLGIRAAWNVELEQFPLFDHIGHDLSCREHWGL
jgi:glycosyltransferase involved in cell wall biosynthesis